jgi:tetratricopeptide (TPR) repeat protein
MTASRAFGVLLALSVVAGAAPTEAEIFLWTDKGGHTHATNDPADIPADALRKGGESHASDFWRGDWSGPRVADPVGDSSTEEGRLKRILRGAVHDLERGESARAAAALESVLRRAPGRPEAHWYLALLDRQRGRFESAQGHLEAFLAHAGDEYDDWRGSAMRRMRTLRDEKRLATAGSELELRPLRSTHFDIRYDANLAEAAPDYPRTVTRYLEDAYRHGEQRLGVVPAEATGVVLYAKAAYRAAYAERFSFPTVGFFDGRIHVVSAAHPAGELRGLLFHEYTHALFRERTGGHRPFWLNEGFAELAERASRRREALTGSERAELRRHIDAGTWISLKKLAPGFGGLSASQARLAYLEATAAAAWIEARTSVQARRDLLDRLGRGMAVDDALRAELDVDTAAIDGAVRREIAEHFPRA